MGRGLKKNLVLSIAVITVIATLLVLAGITGCSNGMLEDIKDKIVQDEIDAAAGGFSASKAITVFSFLAADNAALSADIIETTTGTDIFVTVPFGTTVTALIPTISYTGTSISPASGMTQDFTSSVSYTVTAEDSTEQYFDVIVSEPVVGDAYQGGIIAYILESGDTGYDANFVHGLIAANADQSTDIVWISGGSTQITSVPNGTETAIGTGQVNTTNIISQAVAAGNSDLLSYAAGLCDYYTNADTGTGVYSDWHLPSLDELNKLYINEVEIGGFADDYYWSSSEYDSSSAWFQYFYDGYQANYGKGNAYRVRAVRAF
ncbi:MAG: DUF1566 domain-containing protein [Spirochaetia bacterium]|jgi:hypothetical protein|nr:DUF1566 domain-containing protein [Spirochaetia bacterium]